MKNWFENPENKKMGLVLGGGGARGCYEIGAWQMLNQANIEFDCAAGTSIGALVSAIYTQQTLDRIVEFVGEIHPQAIAKDLFDFPENFSQVLKSHKEISSYMEKYILSNKGMDISPLKSAVEKMFSYPLFSASKIDFACMTFNVTKKRPEAYFKKDMTAENSVDILLASASCYPAFPMMVMNGDDYIDGGYADNVPVDLALKMGAKKILAINVEGPGITLPLQPGLDIVYVKPMLPLGNFLDFSSESCIRSMHIGYLETGRLIGEFTGYLYTFTKDSAADLCFLDEYLSYRFMLIHQNLSERQTLRIVKDSVGFRPSSLSKMASSDEIYGRLVQALAYICQLEAVKLYTVNDFLKQLLALLSQIRLETVPDDLNSVWEYISSLSEKQNIALLHALIVQEKGQINDLIGTLERLFFKQMMLAWTWYFIEETS